MLNFSVLHATRESFVFVSREFQHWAEAQTLAWSEVSVGIEEKGTGKL